MPEPTAIITAVIGLVTVALTLVKGIAEACAAFGTEHDLVQRVKNQLQLIALRIQPLQHGQRLSNAAAAKALQQLEGHLAKWQPQLDAYLQKPTTGWRKFAKGVSRFIGLVPNMKRIMLDIQGGLEVDLAALKDALVQPVITVHRDLPNPYIKPYALNMLKGLLSEAHNSTQPPKVVVLRGETGIGKSILSILVAKDLEAAVHEQGQGNLPLPEKKKKNPEKLFNGGVYRYPLSNWQRTQGLPNVTCTLQQWLARCLRYQQQGADPEALYMELNTTFNTDLQDRKHLVVIDGAWDQELVRMLRCEHMQGPLLVTSEASLWEQHQQYEVPASTVAAAAAWPGAAGGQGHSVLEVELRSGPLAEEAMLDASKLMWLILESSGILFNLSAEQREIADEVVGLCGGNLEATDMMAQTLAAVADIDQWRTARDLLSTTVGDKLNVAIAVSVKALQDSSNPKDQKAAAAFLMLRHVHAERMLPVPLVQLLIKGLAPATKGTGEVLDEREAHSLLTLLVHQSLLARGTMSDKKYTYFTTPVVDIYLAKQTADEDIAGCINRSKATAAEQRQLALVLLVLGRKNARAWAWQHLQLPGDPPSATTPLMSSPELLGAVMCLDDTQGFLSWSVGRTLAQAGLYASALGLFQQALQRQPADPLKPDLAVLRAHTAQSMAAVLVEEAGDNSALMPAAAAAATESLDGMEALNMSQAEIADAYINAGAAKAGLKQFAEAEALFLRTLEINEALDTRGPSDKHTIIALNNLGFVLVKQGKLSARARLDDALARVVAALKGTRTHAVVLDTMALLLDAEGKTAEAVKSSEASFKMKEKVLGVDHPMTKATKQRLECLKQKVQSAQKPSK